MKKSDLIEDLAAAAEVTKSQARIMVDRLVEHPERRAQGGTLPDVSPGDVRR